MLVRKMVDEEEEVSMNPAKRIRLSSRLNSDTDEYDGELNSFSSRNEYNSVTPVSNEGTLTSDSGFNELTPPRTLDEELANNQLPSCSSVTPPSMEENSTARKLADSDDDSMDSTASDCSGLSSIAYFSEENKSYEAELTWLERQMLRGENPRQILAQILPSSAYTVPEGISNSTLWTAIAGILSEMPRRERLRHINTIEDVVRLVKVCRKVIVLTGAGVSVSCGIPDFRSKNGIYSRLAKDFPGLPDPQSMFEINYFRRDPRPFFKFAQEIFPGQFTPSLCHRFIRQIEVQNKLLRNYTQNIDTLEQVAGINNVIQCHGSFATATCRTCKFKVSSHVIKEDIYNRVIPKCPRCAAKSALAAPCTSPPKYEDSQLPGVSQPSAVTFSEAASPFIDNSEGVMKPDIVFFGEGLSEEFHDRLAADKEECDLLIVIGSSLKVRPVALIPSALPSSVPQILINREPLPHLTFDVELLGDCDVIVSELCRRIGGKWLDLSSGDAAMEELQELPARFPAAPESDEVDADYRDPKDESDIEALRTCWAPKLKENVASRLPEGKFLYDGKHRYVFPGAEVYYDPDEEEDDSSSDSSSDDEDARGSTPELLNKSEDTVASPPPAAQAHAAAERESEPQTSTASSDVCDNS